ncbi:MAG: LysR family transcriptional regulator [Verrucomicrobiales bacterium]|nr:LysR family transcriptional regulator [Verrucomicrobiales bacterium]
MRIASGRWLSMTATVGFSEMQVFVAVVTEGSFTAAASLLSTDKARVSRIVRRIEEKFGARLLNRSSRRLSMTAVGQEYFERAQSILAAVEEAEAAVARQTVEPQGRLKITATPEFGITRVDGWIADFLAQWPKVTAETVYATRFVDIIHEGIDVAIRIGELESSDLSARRLGEITYGLYASPEYLERSGVPRSVQELGEHDLVMKGSRSRGAWTLNNGTMTEKVERTPRCMLDNVLAARNFSKAGLGIALLPRFMAQDDVDSDALMRVLPDWEGRPLPVHAVFASTRYMDPKVRGFIDLCIERFRRGAVLPDNRRDAADADPVRMRA